ncbi:MAG: helix-turn-helix transcriptional regulator [Deltaproteobacteria bacterium]|nr:helix-turn-helix transcriptional regulator [Deltaproteobacteria bacterium]
MSKLIGQDIKALMECVREIYSMQDPEAFPLGMLKIVEKVIPSHITAYCRVVRPGNGAVTSEILSESRLSGVDAFNRNIHEHPFINIMHPGVLRPHPFMEDIVRSLSKRLPGFGSPPGKTAVKISDALTDRQLRSLAMYNEGFRNDRVNYQMSLVLGYGDSCLSVACFHRDTKDFSERERLILNLLGPHIIQASRNAEINAARRSFAANGELDGGVLTLAPDRRVGYLTEGAGRVLAQYFKPLKAGGHLPEDLDRWVRKERYALESVGEPPPKPFKKAGASKNLLVRIINGRMGEQTLLVTEEQREAGMHGRLESLDLTSREAEVLYWVAQGKSNMAVSGILGISLNTVKKHLDKVYQKLGVENRTAAAKLALEAIGKV